jgi:hypothetical protein
MPFAQPMEEAVLIDAAKVRAAVESLLQV